MQSLARWCNYITVIYQRFNRRDAVSPFWISLRILSRVIVARLSLFIFINLILFTPIRWQVLLNIFKRAGPFKGTEIQNEAFLGLHDLYKEGEWVTVLGDSLAKTGYSKWSKKWGGQPDNGGGIQHCGALVANEGSMDDMACEIMLPFFCELPLIRPLY